MTFDVGQSHDQYKVVVLAPADKAGSEEVVLGLGDCIGLALSVVAASAEFFLPHQTVGNDPTSLRIPEGPLPADGRSSSQHGTC